MRIWVSWSWLLAFALVATGCQRFESVAFGGQRGRQRPPPSQERPPAEPTADLAKKITIEFDLPPDVMSDVSKVSGFQVGFFSGQSQLVRALEFPRSAAQITGAKVRLEVPLIPIADSREASVSVQVRLLTGGTAGAWSVSAGSVTLPVIEREARSARAAGDSTPGATAPRESRRKNAKPLTVPMVEAHMALTTALKSVLDGDITMEKAVATYSRPQDLAVAILLSKKLELPFSRLCAAIEASPEKTLHAGLLAAKPSVDPAKEIRAVASEARKLVGGRRPRQPVTPDAPAASQPAAPAPQ